MYVRPPSSPRGTLKLPENYSGNAFSRQPIYTEMPPPARAIPAQKHEEIPRGAPISDLPPDETELESKTSVYNEITPRNAEERVSDSHASPVSSIFSSLLPKGALSSHFPFGHGIGSEELLILAVMLLVFLSGNETGETDSEFILLLGLLLFAG